MKGKCLLIISDLMKEQQKQHSTNGKYEFGFETQNSFPSLTIADDEVTPTHTRKLCLCIYLRHDSLCAQIRCS